MNTKIEQLEMKVDELEAENSELREKNTALINELARVGALEDTKKIKILEQILKENPNIYSEIEFGNAFDQASKK